MKKMIGVEDFEKKERHVVSWNQQEDEILREQVCIHGTQNWTIIASKFKDKTTRQLKRRWYTYLSSDFKKGGWTPEEDMLLCRAQRILGNRWIEIAKVVSGRTDNAVKNRFATLCKKREKLEALAEESGTSYIDPYNKRIVLPNGTSETKAPIKRMRTNSSDVKENYNFSDSKQNTTTTSRQPRQPFALLAQNFQNVNNLPLKTCVGNTKEVTNDAQDTKNHGSFLKKNDPKINALMQQAELLSSLALKVNTENTDKSLENAWKALQEFLSQSKESDTFRCRVSDIDVRLEDLKELLEDLHSSKDGSHRSLRQPDFGEESPCYSEYSTGSTVLHHATGDRTEETQTKRSALHQNTGSGCERICGREDKGVLLCEKGILSCTTGNQESFSSCDDQTNNQAVSASSTTEFSSPLKETPLFKSLAAGIPSPKFSESERRFLLKTLGMESPLHNPSSKPVQSPSCKRSLFRIL